MRLLTFATNFPSKHLLPWVWALGLGAASNCTAQSLMEMYKSAQSYDATFQSAKAQFDATLAKAAQANALLLPTVGLTTSVTRSYQELPLAGSGSYGTQTATLGVSQPLYNSASWNSVEQSKKQQMLAEAQRSAAEQDLMVRVSQAYFDALAAQDSLTFVKSQKAAVSEQLAFAQRNFEVGTSTITDTREAQARFDLVVAQELAAENEVLVKTIALRQLVGLPQAKPNPALAPITLQPVAPAEVNHWVELALANNPSLQQLQVGLDVARLDTRKAEAGHKPTLNLNGSYSAINNNGTATSPNAPDSRVNQAQLGVTLQLPLFAGFSIQNKVKESLALEDKARSDLEAAKRTVTQSTRTTFLGVQSLLAQVKAFEAAEVSSQSALDANKLGYQVGVRINVDVLNAQSQLFDTKAKLAKTRYDVLVGGLKLRQVAGVLKTDDLQAVQNQLAP